MSRSRGKRTPSRDNKHSTADVINTEHHVDGAGAVLARISLKKDETEQVFNKEYHMAGLIDLAPRRAETAAKITCSFDISSKHYGNGASVMTSVTLVVDNTDEAIARGFDIARAVCEEEGASALAVAKNLHHESSE